MLPEYCKKPILCVCGSNIDLNLLCVLIERDLVRKKLWVRLNLAVEDTPGSLALVTASIAKHSANVLDVRHDRYSPVLGLVSVNFLLEVRDSNHGQELIKALKKEGINVSENS